MMERRMPNVLITGIPIGDTREIEMLVADVTKLTIIDLRSYVEENGIGHSESLRAVTKMFVVMNRKKLHQMMLEKLQDGGFVVECNATDVLPVYWFDYVIVGSKGDPELNRILDDSECPVQKLGEYINNQLWLTVPESRRARLHYASCRVYSMVSNEQIRNEIKSFQELIDGYKKSLTEKEETASIASDTSASDFDSSDSESDDESFVEAPVDYGGIDLYLHEPAADEPHGDYPDDFIGYSHDDSHDISHDGSHDDSHDDSYENSFDYPFCDPLDSYMDEIH